MPHVVNGRDSNPKTLGIKRFAGQVVKSGTILLKQKGLRFRPGTNVGLAKDWTLFALCDGKVAYDPRKIVSVIRTTS
jgi:large subunit ribosomal protein L27